MYVWWWLSTLASSTPNGCNGTCYCHPHHIIHNSTCVWLKKKKKSDLRWEIGGVLWTALYSWNQQIVCTLYLQEFNCWSVYKYWKELFWHQWVVNATALLFAPPVYEWKNCIFCGKVIMKQLNISRDILFTVGGVNVWYDPNKGAQNSSFTQYLLN